MDAKERIERRENRLLRREAYLRRTRHVAVGLALLMFIGAIVFPMFESRSVDESDVGAYFLLGFVLLFWASLADAKIRHIETIRHYRSGA